MIKKVSVKKLKKILQYEFPEISAHARDEMAIPSYLHWNPLIRRLVWGRYEKISELSDFSKEMNVLEFGCGLGVFLPELFSKCNNVYAIDIFPQYAKKLCEDLELKIIFVNNILEIQNDFLDIIIAAEVFEHLERAELSEYLHEFYEKLKDTGRLLVSGPTENFIYRLGRKVAGFGEKGNYHHTNVDDLIEEINKLFILKRTKTLPFKIPPYLYKVCEFVKRERKI